ncbi:hypothetical protein [Sphingomonas sp. RS2018]
MPRPDDPRRCLGPTIRKEIIDRKGARYHRTIQLLAFTHNVAARFQRYGLTVVIKGDVIGGRQSQRACHFRREDHLTGRTHPGMIGHHDTPSLFRSS